MPEYPDNKFKKCNVSCCVVILDAHFKLLAHVCEQE